VQTDVNQPASRCGCQVTSCAASDFEGVFPLLQQLWPDRKLDRSKLEELFGEALEASSRVLLCAKAAQQVVGYGSLTLKTHLWHGGLIAWIDELVVDQTARGRGIGRLLLAHLTKVAAEKGCCAMELDSAFHRREAHDFYEKSGFAKRAFLFSKSI
jgi:GNAT superfamily N-acetyltransferase